MKSPHRHADDESFVEEYFDTHGDEDWSPRYNIAPTQPVPVIRQHPHDMSGSAGMINARSETATNETRIP